MSIAFVGVTYLIWALSMGVIRHAVNQLLGAPPAAAGVLDDESALLHLFRGAMSQGSLVFDVCGVLWLLISLILVVGASRQRWSVSWAWFCAMLQTMACTLVDLWAILAVLEWRMYVPLKAPADAASTIGWASFSIALALALVIWVTVLVWLLSDHARLRRGPSLRDGLRTHVGA